MKWFPVSAPAANVDNLLLEWQDSQIADDLPLFSEDVAVDAWWGEVGEMTLSSGELRFPMYQGYWELSLFCGTCTARCSFTLVRRMDTIFRPSLGNDTIGALLQLYEQSLSLLPATTNGHNDCPLAKSDTAVQWETPDEESWQTWEAPRPP